MSGFIVVLVVLAFLVIGRLGRHASASEATRRQRIRAQASMGMQRARRRVEIKRPSPMAGSAEWTPGPARLPDRVQPVGSDAPQWRGAQQWQLGRAAPVPPTPGGGSAAVARTGTASASSRVTELHDDPDIRAFLSHLDDGGNEPTGDASTSVLAQPTPTRYIGSAALESTLDSTIESSLLGMPAGPVTMAALPGGPKVELPQGVEAQVTKFLADGHEVAAVRLVCDEMDCGILEAMRTVRGYA